MCTALFDPRRLDSFLLYLYMQTMYVRDLKCILEREMFESLLKISHIVQTPEQPVHIYVFQWVYD